VKRILGTAEDYRRLYPDGSTIPRTISTLTPTKAPAGAKKSTAKKKAPAKKAPAKKTPPKKAPAAKHN